MGIFHATILSPHPVPRLETFIVLLRSQAGSGDRLLPTDTEADRVLDAKVR